MRKLFFLCGMLSPIVYLFMTILGAVMWPDYSHIYHSVSELLERGAPNKILLDILLSTFSMLGLLFGIGVLQLVRQSDQKCGMVCWERLA